MKNLILALTFLTMSGPAFAEQGLYKCSNGDMDTLGDNYSAINITEDIVEFLPHEGSLTLSHEDITLEDNVFTVVNKNVVETSEGSTSTKLINAIMTQTGSKLELAISYDYGPFLSVSMRCMPSN